MSALEAKLANPETPFVERLRILCGYCENATDTSVRVLQDDATKDWIVVVGKNTSYYGSSMEEAFEAAFVDPTNNPF